VQGLDSVLLYTCYCTDLSSIVPSMILTAMAASLYNIVIECGVLVYQSVLQTILTVLQNLSMKLLY